MSEKKYMATQAAIVPVDNGFIVTLYTYDANMMLIAPTLEDAAAILRDVDFRTTTPGVMAQAKREMQRALEAGPGVARNYIGGDSADARVARG